MYIIKKFLRDISSSLLLIVGYCLLLFVAFNSIYLLNKITEEQPNTVIGDYKDKQSYRVTRKNGMWVEGQELVEREEKIGTIFSALTTNEGNTYINIQGVVGKIASECTVNVVLSYNESCNRVLKRGIYPDFGSITESRAVVIGEYFEDCTIKIGDKEYININGADYLVTGVFKDLTYSGMDKAIVTFYSDIDDALIEELSPYIYSTYAEITVCGNDCENVFRKVESELTESTYFDVATTATFSYDGINTIISKIKDVVMILIVFFCVINSIIITNMWLRCRQSEIAVRKACGYSDLQVIKLIVIDMLKYMLIAFVLAIFAEGCYYLVCKPAIDVMYIVNYCLCSLILVAVVIMLSVFVHFKIVTNTSMAQGVQRK